MFKGIMKLFSARFIVVIGMTFTFCWITNKALNIFIVNLENDKLLPTTEKILMFLLGAFASQFATIINNYFHRGDRSKPGEETK